MSRLDVTTDCTDCEARIRAEVIEEVKDGLKALKDKGYSTYYIDDELTYLEQLKEQK